MIVVTGGAGFIGSNLVADLNAAGRNDVVIVDNLELGAKWRNIAKRKYIDIVPIEDTGSFLAGLSGADCVFHLGANSSTTATDADAILRTNLRSSMKWWNWCAQTCTPLIYASSAATYGDGQHGFSDRDDLLADTLAPLNLYGWSKHAFDRWAMQRAQEGIAPPSWAGLKFFNVYGPNEYHKCTMQSLVAKNTAAIRDGEVVPLFRSHRNDYIDGGQLRDFIYVKDCTAVMMWLFETGMTKDIFNIGTGVARSFIDLIQAIGLAVGREPNVNYVDMPESIRNNYQYFTQASMDKLHEAGFRRSFHSLDDGVGDYVRTYLLDSDKYR